MKALKITPTFRVLKNIVTRDLSVQEKQNEHFEFLSFLFSSLQKDCEDLPRDKKEDEILESLLYAMMYLDLPQENLNTGHCSDSLTYEVSGKPLLLGKMSKNVPTAELTELNTYEKTTTHREQAGSSFSRKTCKICSLVRKKHSISISRRYSVNDNSLVSNEALAMSACGFFYCYNSNRRPPAGNLFHKLYISLSERGKKCAESKDYTKERKSRSRKCSVFPAFP